MLKKIDRYRITGEIGRGGMAFVYRGYDARVGRDVAIKVMQGAYANDRELRKRFKREADSIAALEHPSIVPVYDFGYHESQPYLVMRYMENGTLLDRIRKRPVSLAESAVIMNRIGRGLDEAHKRGIIHRDLKPSNILFDKYDNAYLGDFGIVKMMDDTAITPADVNLMAGTPSYMSPEQIRGDTTIDGRADLYGLGAILFQMLTGRRPFEADDPATVIYMHITMPVPDICSVNAELPVDLDSLIVKAMAKDPDARYPSAASMIDDLNLIVGGVTPSKLNALPEIADGPVEVGPAHPSTPVLIPAQDWPPDRDLKPAVPAPMFNPPPPRPRTAHRPVSAMALLVIVVGLISLGLIFVMQWGSANASLTQSATPSAAPTSVAATQALEPTTLPGPGLGITGQVAFVSAVTGSPDIYFLDLLTRSVTRMITPLPNKNDPAWSPDGQRIAFTSQDNGQHSLYIANLDGSGLQAIWSDPGEVLSPSWSPDGGRIAFVGVQDGSREIYTISSGGQSMLRLTDNGAAEYKPDWSPDGAQIVFYSGQAGTLIIYVINADGSNEIVLTSPDERNYDPVWSPDGQKIAFVSERDGNAEIYVMDPDGTDQIRLTTNEYADTFPTWSPDGTLILFVSRRGGDADIYIMRADGTGEQLAQNTPDDEMGPVWQPAP